MMKEQYGKEVARRLLLPRAKRKEVLRDLEEAFASAAEHGESEQQVIDLLGTPEEFAAAMNEQLGVPQEFFLRRSRRLAVLFFVLTALLLAAAVADLWRDHLLEVRLSSVCIIGGADGPTHILLSAAPGIDPAILLFLLAAILAAAGLRQLLRCRRARKK